MSKRGFTLIELLMVIGVIAILASFSFAALGSVQRAAKRHQTMLVLDKIDAALRTFRGDMGFYPAGRSAKPPLQYHTSGVDLDLVKLDPATGVPLSDNDDVWAPAGAPTTWTNGNGLLGSIGSVMATADKERAVKNAALLRDVEMDRFYHIGNYGNVACQGIDTPSGFVIRSNRTVTIAPASYWSHMDPIGPVTLGERELKGVFDHFRIAPTTIDRDANPWTAYPQSDETSTGTSMVRTAFQKTMLQTYGIYCEYLRPRDATDAYLRALRHGVDSGNVIYDSSTNAAGEAQGATLTSKTVTIASTSDPWHDDYLGDQLDKRLRADADGDGQIDILDAYGQPLVYIAEGLPARPRINSKLASINENPFIYELFGKTPNQCNRGRMLLYHPDPERESTYYINANTAWSYVTDRPNNKGVPVRADAEDIALIDAGCKNSVGSGQVQIGSGWIWALHGINPRDSGDPYWLAGTLIPGRIGAMSVPTNKRGGDPYYCLSKDGSTLVEPWTDTDGDGEHSATEMYYDRIRNGTYDDNISANDMRRCAPPGEEREFELWSAGPDRRFHALRGHATNADNLRPQTTRKR